MKKFTLLSCLILSMNHSSYPIKLNNQFLKIADEGGLFNFKIIEILKAREKIKNFLSGKLILSGAELQVKIIDKDLNPLDKNLHLIISRPETLFGATFIVVCSNHPFAQNLYITETKNLVEDFLQKSKNKKLVDRYDQAEINGVNTGLFVKNPITNELIPLFISDYILEDYDTRATHAHIAIPAHNQKDFEFAKKYKLSIKLVVDSLIQDQPSSPLYNKNKELIAAYQGEYDDCIIVNSDFLNGSIQTAHQKALEYLIKNTQAQEYKKPYLYQLGQKQHSLKELQMLEALFIKENKVLSQAQKEQLQIVLIQARADFLTIVEQFLVIVKDKKDFITELLAESCKARQNLDAYIFKWAQMNTNEPEKAIFKRDINSFIALSTFCTELIDFLEDFASSCPVALENLQRLKHS